MITMVPRLSLITLSLISYLFLSLLISSYAFAYQFLSLLTLSLISSYLLSLIISSYAFRLSLLISSYLFLSLLISSYAFAYHFLSLLTLSLISSYLFLSLLISSYAFAHHFVSSHVQWQQVAIIGGIQMSSGNRCLLVAVRSHFGLRLGGRINPARASNRSR
jgi:hypothetical protein